MSWLPKVLHARRVSEENTNRARNRRQRCIIMDTVFVLDTEEYKPMGYIARGSYGVVWKVGSKSGEICAMKKLVDVCDSLPRTRAALREIRILSKVRHPFVINLKEVVQLPDSDRQTFKEVYVVYELMERNLSQHIGRSIRRKCPLSEHDCKYILSQLLRGLNYLHSANVLHRDLKPSNVLLKRLKNGNFIVKISDFGLSRLYNEDEMTTKVTTITYRAPELLIQNTTTRSGSYNAAVDVWSMGCIFAEMLIGHVLFSGSTVHDVLVEICKLIPKPRDNDLDFIEDRRARIFVRDNLCPPEIRLRDRLTLCGISEQAIELLEKMLAFDPRKRITVQDALRHPFLESVTVQDLAQRLELDTSEVDILNQDAPIDLHITPDEASAELSTSPQRREVLWKQINGNIHPGPPAN